MEQIQFNSDIDSMTRAAFFATFADEVKRGDAHAFFVNYTKFQTIDERERILKEAKKAMGEFRLADRERLDWTREELARGMMKERIAERAAHGQWDDEWVFHPQPTIKDRRTPAMRLGLAKEPRIRLTVHRGD